MGEVKHTPGPWAVEVQSFGSAIAKDECCIATAHGTAAITRAELPHEANARLIAAAPELLEALKAINDAAPDMPDALWRQVDAAIAKAEGRTP